MIEPSWARRDTIDHDWSLPPRPAVCEFDYGRGSAAIQAPPPNRLRRRHRVRAGRSTPLRQLEGRRGAALRKCGDRHHLPRWPNRSRVLHRPGRPIGSAEPSRVDDASPRSEGICAANLKWTIVVLRDGRRSRPWHADVAQLVAHHLAKVRVAGSNPVIRSRVQSHQPQRWSGRVVRQRPAKPCTRVRFPSPPPSFLSAISSAGERFPDTEEVTGSIPVSRTSITAVQGINPLLQGCPCGLFAGYRF